MNLRDIPVVEKVEKVQKEKALKAASFLMEGKSAAQCTDAEKADAACKMFERLLNIELTDSNGDKLIMVLRQYCDTKHLKNKEGSEVSYNGKLLADLAFWPSWTATAALGALYKRPETMALYLYSFASALNTVERQAAFKALWDAQDKSKAKAKLIKAAKA